MMHKEEKSETRISSLDIRASREANLGSYLLGAGLALALLVLSGCGPGSIADLRDRPHSTYSVEIPADYETVYERIAQRARQRYVSVGLPAHQPGVSARLAPERQEANVTLWDSGRIKFRYRITADIRALDPTRTWIDVYAGAKDDTQEAPLWALWANTPLGE
jgi:hypothetical protein